MATSDAAMAAQLAAGPPSQAPGPCGCLPKWQAPQVGLGWPNQGPARPNGGQPGSPALSPSPRPGSALPSWRGTSRNMLGMGPGPAPGTALIPSSTPGGMMTTRAGSPSRASSPQQQLRAVSPAHQRAQSPMGMRPQAMAGLQSPQGRMQMPLGAPQQQQQQPPQQQPPLAWRMSEAPVMPWMASGSALVPGPTRGQSPSRPSTVGIPPDLTASPPTGGTGPLPPAPEGSPGAAARPCGLPPGGNWHPQPPSWHTAAASAPGVLPQGTSQSWQPGGPRMTFDTPPQPGTISTPTQAAGSMAPAPPLPPPPPPPSILAPPPGNCGGSCSLPLSGASQGSLSVPPPAAQPASGQLPNPAALLGGLPPGGTAAAKAAREAMSSAPGMPRTNSTRGVAAHPQLAPPQSQGGGLGARTLSVGNAEWMAVHDRAAGDLSSIHLSPSPNKHDREEILEHCRDTTKLVNQLASALRGLEADVSSLRRENASLRQTMFTALPAEQVQQLLQQADAVAETLPNIPGPMEALTRGLLSSASGSSSPALSLALGSGLINNQAALPRMGPLQSARSSTPPPTARPLQSARNSTPPPTARLAQSSISGKEGQKRCPTEAGLASVPEKGVHGSPHFGQTPGLWPSSAVGEGANQQPRTPSPGNKRLTVGPLARPGFVAVDVTQGASPATDSTATIMASGSGQEPSAEGSAGRGEASEAPGPWAVELTFWLGPEINVAQAASKVRVLDRDTIVSVNAAVDGLNRGTLRCPDDACVVYSASNGGFFLLYRQGQRDKVCSLALQISRQSEEAPEFAPVLRGDEAAGNAGMISGGNTPSVPVNNVSLAATPEVNSRTDAEAPSMLAPNIIGPAAQPQPAEMLVNPPSTALQGPNSSAASTPPSRGGSLSGTVLIGSSADPPQPQKDPLCVVEELVTQGEVVKAEDFLAQTLRSSVTVNEVCFDVLIGAFERERHYAKAEEWLVRSIELGLVPCEASYSCVILSLCQQGALPRAEELTLQMMRHRVRPSKELFNVIIRMFSDRRDAPKVEEWLLNAGQSGWTPEQAAFDAIVLLYAEVDALKAEEWLSRGQQTEYRLPDACYGAVVQAFLRLGSSGKVNEWLSRMLAESRVPSDSLLREVIALHIESGDIARAEAWLTQLAGRSSAPVDDLRTALFDAAIRTGDIVYAERQIAALSEPDADRTMQAVSALMEKGDVARAKVLCERYRALGGNPTLDICNALLFACAATGDADGAERAVRALASAQVLSESQASLLRRAAGEERAADLLAELGMPDPCQPPSAPGHQTQAPAAGHRESTPASGASKTGTEKSTSGKKSLTPPSTNRNVASKASSAASAKAQARRSPGASPGVGARSKPLR